MSGAEFARAVIDACAASSKVVECTLSLWDEPVVKLRVDLRGGTFIDVFHNADTGKVSFAWISGNQRLLGVDNTRGWHLHPLRQPESHQPHPAMTFAEFLTEVEKEIPIR